MAKMMDVWGRAEGFLLMIVFLTIGLVLMAVCDSFEIYCAANVRLKLLTEPRPSFLTHNCDVRHFITLGSMDPSML